MPWFDLPQEKLREYRIQTAEPAGLDEWWADRITQARSQARPLTLTRVDADVYGPLQVSDAELSGAGGDRVRGWFLRPAGPPGSPNPPVVVTFIGYGGGRGVPSDHALLPALGYSVLVMDTRGQGGRWSSGATADGDGGGPALSMVMTRGITDPQSYYYTRLITDAVLALDAATELSGGAKVAVTGHSQGGGLALAAAALQPDRVALCHASFPFLCDIQRGITLAPHAPYTEIPEFLSENVDLVPQALATLAYVDCALLARRITAPCLLATGLMDVICPPSTVFAAYNEITADKDIAVYPFSDHSVPGAHTERQLRHLREHFPA